MSNILQKILAVEKKATTTITILEVSRVYQNLTANSKRRQAENCFEVVPYLALLYQRIFRPLILFALSSDVLKNVH